MLLQDLLARSARSRANQTAVVDPDGPTTYGELDALANRLARTLAELGVGPGSRVGLWLPKGATAIAVMQAALRLRAAYVPVDPQSPTTRAARILGDCTVSALVTDGPRAGALLDEGLDLPRVLVDDEVSETATTRSWSSVREHSAEPLAVGGANEDDLAYILYTSGSTGQPKGVCITQRAAMAFVGWAVGAVDAQPSDTFGNHAAFHFDLSVLDLYAAFAVGAAVSIVPESLAFNPARLAAFLEEQAISVWYSVPSALILMMDQGGLLERQLSDLRVVLFAGEPFPLPQLRRLMERFPDKRYMNLYGPTETNVCTFHEVTAIDPAWTSAVPIGKACCGDEAWVRRDDGSPASPGEQGELIVKGPTVMRGYWGAATLPDEVWATGDLVRELEDGSFHYLGRRDDMVKIRGHRVELGEIEAALGEHPRIRQAAVLAIGDGVARKLVAFFVPEGKAPTLLEVKAHCARRVPRYMIVDRVHPLASLPRTPNGKTDRKALLAESGGGATEDREPDVT